MKLLIFGVVFILVALVLIVGITGLLGARLPKAHVASRSILLHQSPQNIYATVRDFGSAPTWRSDVKRIDVQAQPDGRVHFREEGRSSVVNYELAEDIPAQRMVTRILDTDLGYAGKWT